MTTGQWSRRGASVPMNSPRWPPDAVRRVMRLAGVATASADAKTCAGGVMWSVPEERVLEYVILQPHAVKRLIEPAEVAGVVSFLLGPDGRAFTGAPVTMDLGWTAR